MQWFFGVLVLVSLCQVFRKTGQPAWAAFVPLYNVVVLFRVADRPVSHAIIASSCGVAGVILGLVVSDFVGSWLLSLSVGVITFGFWMSGCIGLAERFGRTPVFGFALAVLPVVFLPILAFGPARYEALGRPRETLSLS